MTAAGRFVSLEGGEGAGKSTQVRALATALSARGVDVVVTREPGGSDGAEAIRALLLRGETSRWSARSEALLFAAARADHVERVIAPALAAGRWVISDRYVDSTRAYQGGAEGIADEELLALHHFGVRGLMPDRTFVLELPVSEGERRAQSRDGDAGDRFARRGAAFHAAVAEAFHAIAAREPVRVRLVDGSRPVAHVTDDLLAALTDLLP